MSEPIWIEGALVLAIGAASAYPMTPYIVAMALVVVGTASLGYESLVKRRWTTTNFGFAALVVLGDVLQMLDDLQARTDPVR